MTENVLDLQRLPEINSLGFTDPETNPTCTVCSHTCCCTAVEE